MEIRIPKYNTKDYELEVNNYDGEISKILFTVEDCTKNTMFKKELNNGITKVNDNDYILSIYAKDTKKMNSLYTYKYFLEVVINSPNYVQTVVSGDFIIEDSSRDLGDEING